mgnify:CR=1 FL=1
MSLEDIAYCKIHPAIGIARARLTERAISARSVSPRADCTAMRPRPNAQLPEAASASVAAATACSAWREFLGLVFKASPNDKRRTWSMSAANRPMHAPGRTGNKARREQRSCSKSQ